jgi:hypothetical protein
MTIGTLAEAEESNRTGAETPPGGVAWLLALGAQASNHAPTGRESDRKQCDAAGPQSDDPRQPRSQTVEESVCLSD